MKASKALTLLLIALPLLIVGCGSKDVDPTNKIDAPGYYNGPVKPRGGPQASGAGDKAPASSQTK